MTFADPETSLVGSIRQCASLLRQELTARNQGYADLYRLLHMTCYGETPVVIYQSSECGNRHGNFIPASYCAILSRPEWRRRLQKVHSSGRHAFPNPNAQLVCMAQ